MKETERCQAQSILQGHKDDVFCAERKLDRHDTLLEWIAAQFSEMSSAYAPSSQEDRHDRDLLDGWEGYYVLMREKLQEVQEKRAKRAQDSFWSRIPPDSEAEQAYCERRWPMEYEKPLKALLDWIKQEFPEIDAKSASFKQSDGDHPARATAFDSQTTSSEPACKALQVDAAGKSAQRRRKTARERSPLSQIQSSKVSKPGQKKRRPLDQKSSNTRQKKLLAGALVENKGEKEVQKEPQAALCPAFGHERRKPAGHSVLGPIRSGVSKNPPKRDLRPRHRNVPQLHKNPRISDSENKPRRRQEGWPLRPGYSDKVSKTPRQGCKGDHSRVKSRSESQPQRTRPRKYPDQAVRGRTKQILQPTCAIVITRSGRESKRPKRFYPY